MIIENHRLTSSLPDFKPEYQFDEQGRPLPKEGLIAVIHYAVAYSARQTAQVLKGRDYVSCHLAIDDQGNILQQVPFDRVAWHAGKSSYRGRTDVNAFSLGIEIGNPGPLIKGKDGKFRDVYRKLWEGETVEARHKSGVAPSNWTHWAAYSDRVLDLCSHICTLWRQTYGIVDVVGHDDVSPGRKFDPGPAFPMQWLHSVIFPREVSDSFDDADTDPDDLAPPTPKDPSVA